MSSGREIKRPVTEEDIRLWEKAWTEMMVTIWRENILRLGIVDTMTLHNTISYRVTDVGGQIQIAHEFMLYGIYVAKGVGKDYRRQHKMGKPRQRRDWFSPRYLSSIDVLTQVETQLYGHAYMGTLSNVVDAMFSHARVRGNRGTVVTPTLSRF